MSSNGNTLGGGQTPDPPPSTWGRPSAPRIGRIGDWSNNGGAGRGAAGAGRFGSLSSLPPNAGATPMGHDDDDDDEGPPREGENWFAGGERSGLNVQNPNARGDVPGGRMVQDILRRAAETTVPRAEEPSSFRGGGHRLGSDEVESAFVPGAEEEQGEAAQRNITFWRNGFSIEGGGFYGYADPANERLLAEINTGRAPVSVLNVRPGQPVEVVVSKRTEEDFVPARRAFEGSGNRLGSPVPSVTAVMPGGMPERGRVTTLFEVDQTAPMTTVQIRLADGTRMPCRMNLTHTVGDIRRFIHAARPDAGRAFTIGTTFPNRTLDDEDATIASAGLANSVVVQRWV